MKCLFIVSFRGAKLMSRVRASSRRAIRQATFQGMPNFRPCKFEPRKQILIGQGRIIKSSKDKVTMVFGITDEVEFPLNAQRRTAYF